MRRIQDWEPHFDLAARAYDLEPVSEYKFHPTRRWLIDRAFPIFRVGVEVEGGAWVNGRHTRGSGYLADCEKYNQAQLLGWLVLRFSPQQVKDGSCWETILAALKARGLED